MAYTRSCLSEMRSRVEGAISFRSLTSLAALLCLLALGPIGLSPSGAATTASPQEVLSMRSARSDTFVDANGKHDTRLYTQAVNYLDGKSWKPIDNTLVASANPDFAFENAANSFHVHFKSSLSDGYLRFDAPGGRASVSVSLEQASGSSAASASGSALSFPNARPDTAIHYGVTGDGLKETLVLKGSDAPASYVFDLTPASGENLSATQQSDGSILFYSKDDSQPAFSISAPSVADTAANGQPNFPAAGMAQMKIEQESDGSFRLAVSIDQNWLSDPSRNFPVYLDPNYNAVTDVQDGYYDTTAGGLPNTTSTELYTGVDAISPYHVFNSVATFDLATIPAGVTITSVNAELTLDGCVDWTCNSNNAGDVRMRQLTSPWTTTTPWSSITSSGTVLANRTFTGTEALNNYYQLTGNSSMVSVIQGMVNGTTPNYGFIINKVSSGGNYAFAFADSRTVPNMRAPYLDVYWTTAGVVLNPLPPLHANGADLSWSTYSGSDFQRYEIHRSTTASFTPSSSTLIGTIADAGVTDFRDTTATPSTAFSYKIVTVTTGGSYNSNEVRNTLPSAGNATVVFQSGLGNGSVAGTFLDDTGPNYGNWGNPYLTVGPLQRALLHFDIRSIPLLRDDLLGGSAAVCLPAEQEPNDRGPQRQVGLVERSDLEHGGRLFQLGLSRRRLRLGRLRQRL